MKGYVSEIFTSFQGEGVFAGRKHLFLRLAACNLRCRYCDTPESLVRTRECRVESDGEEYALENPLSAERVSAILKERASGKRGIHALAVTGGEPLLQDAFLGELLRQVELPVLLETNGVLPGQFEAVRDLVDIVSMDVKLPSNSGERGYWEEHRRFLAAARGKSVYVKVPVDEVTRDEEVRQAARVVASEAPQAPLFIQPILSPDATFQVSVSTLERFHAAASEFLTDVRVLPQAHRFLGIR